MTSKLSRPAITSIPYRAVLPEGFLCPDPCHRPDSMQQNPAINECEQLLQDHFADRADVFVDSGGFVFYDQRSLNIRVRPDLYVAFGVDAAAVFARNGYVVWEAGKPPDFALEVASESTFTVDTNDKPGLYASIGVAEYWRFDPTGGDFYGYALAAEVLVDGAYQPIPITTEPDGMTWGYSPALDLNLCAQGRRLRFYDRKTGRYLHNIAEKRAAYRQTAAERDEERAAHRQAAAERDEERAAHRQTAAARRVAEAEVERLRAELRRIQGQ